jgi:Putative peptidoglycan binding domain
MVGKARPLIVVALAGLVAACGSSTEDRTLSGAGIGAAAGTVLGAVTGVGVIQGALLGGAVGGVTGAVTTEDQVNLGKPAWKHDRVASRGPARTEAGDAALTRNIQSGLAALGYQPGPADGMLGARTRAAIRRYQADNRMAVTGDPSPELWARIKERI